jgi:hypothetical protein
MRSQGEIIKAINEAILHKCTKSLEKSTFEVEKRLLESGRFEAALFRSLVAVIKKADFQAFKESAYFFKPFEYHLGLLSDKQRQEFMEVLERCYPHFVDSTSCFLIVELICDIYLDDRSLAALCRLRTVYPEMPRALVAHGLEHLARNSTDPSIAAKAVNELLQMSADCSKVVQREAEEALARVERKEIEKR